MKIGLFCFWKATSHNSKSLPRSILRKTQWCNCFLIQQFQTMVSLPVQITGVLTLFFSVSKEVPLLGTGSPSSSVLKSLFTSLASDFLLKHVRSWPSLSMVTEMCQFNCHVEFSADAFRALTVPNLDLCRRDHSRVCNPWQLRYFYSQPPDLPKNKNKATLNKARYMFQDVSQNTKRIYFQPIWWV